MKTYTREALAQSADLPDTVKDAAASHVDHLVEVDLSIRKTTLEGLGKAQSAQQKNVAGDVGGEHTDAKGASCVTESEKKHIEGLGMENRDQARYQQMRSYVEVSAPRLTLDVSQLPGDLAKLGAPEPSSPSPAPTVAPPSATPPKPQASQAPGA